MNEIRVTVNFAKGTIKKDSSKIISGDYNSTKLVFDFDREDGIKTLEMLDTNDNLIYDGVIENNEVILVGTDEDGNPCSLFTEEGTYPFEVVLYDENSKLTAVGGKLKITSEAVKVTDDVTNPQLPVFDQLLNRVNAALTNCEQAVEDIYNAEEESENIISNFEGNVEQYTSAFNDNATNKTSDFNDNVTQKINDFDNNASNKITDFNNNANEKVTVLNTIYQNTESLVRGFDTKVENSKGDLDEIVENAQSIYDDFETNAAQKSTDFNSNAAEKIEEFNANAIEKANAFNSNADLKKTEFNNNADSILKKEKQNSMLRNALVKTSASGENITLEDTAECPLSISLKGNISQKTTTGKNLSNAVLKTTVTSNGITCSYNKKDDTYTINGTATANTNFYLNREDNASIKKPLSEYGLVSGNSYILSGCPVGGDKEWSKYKLYLNGLTNYSDGGNGLTFTPTDADLESKYALSLFVAGGVTVNNLVFKPMVRLASTDDTYEPYTGGIASPNPDYSQDMHVVSGDNEIKIFNENLIDPYNVINSSGLSSVYNADKSISYSGTLTKTFAFLTDVTDISLESGDYTFLIDKILNHNMIIRLYYDLANYKDITIIAGNKYRTSEITNNVIAYQIYVDNVNIGNSLNNKVYFQLKKGSTATDYVEHQEQNYHITLPDGMEMCDVGDYEDEFRRSTGKNLSIASGNVNNVVISDTLPEGTYTFSYYAKYDVGTNLKSNDGSGKTLGQASGNGKKKITFTLDEPTKIFINGYSNVSGQTFADAVNQFQLEEGSSATDPEPYGVGVWYKYGRVGKVVLDTLTWIFDSDNLLFQAPMPSDALLTRGIDFLCEICVNGGNVATNSLAVGQGEIVNNGNFYVADTTHTTTEDFLNGVGEKSLYYPLATPEVTPITDTTLIEQLEAIYYAVSYQGQTNISQTNNDAPFKITAEGVYDLNKLVSRVAMLEAE